MLFNQFRVNYSELPIIKYSIRMGDANHILDVLTSSEYENYQKKFTLLTNKEDNFEKVVHEIKEQGNKLYSKHTKVMNLKKIGFILLILPRLLSKTYSDAIFLQ